MTSTAYEGKSGLKVAVIAGGAGFIGSQLAEVLIAQGQTVICLDNYTTGKEENLKGLFGNPSFTFKVGDINLGLPKLDRVDEIYHLAGVEEYINGTDVSVETLLVNSIGTKNLLELAREHRAKILLASSIDVYAGLLGTLSMETYFGVSKRDEERFSHHEAKRYAEALTTEYFKKYHLDARIARLADVYGPRMELRAGTEIAELLAESLQNEDPKLTVHGDGLRLIHPTFVSDVVFGLLKSMQAENSRGKIYALVNPEPLSILNFANRLRTVVDHNIPIVFVPDIRETRLPLHPTDLLTSQKELGWRSVVGLQEGLRRTVAHFKERQIEPEIPSVPLGQAVTYQRSLAAVYSPTLQPFSAAARLKNLIHFLIWGDDVSSKQATTARPKNWKLRLTVLLSVAFISLSTLVPLGGVAFHSGYGVWQLQSSAHNISIGQTEAALAEASSAKAALGSGMTELEDLNWLLSMVGLGSGVDNYHHLLQASINFSQTVEDLSLSAKVLSSMGDSLAQTDVTAKVAPLDNVNQINQAKDRLKKAQDSLSLVEADLSQVNEAELPWFAKDSFRQLGSDSKALTVSVSSWQDGTSILPEILGINGPRTYLVLVLDNTELRAGGGVVESYGLLKFDGGKLRDIQTDDVFRADSSLTKLAGTPDPLKNYLGIANFDLRNSSWSPDFPNWSSLARDLFYNETGRSVDGVITLDLTALQSLLRVTGPVVLADYGETVSQDNLIEKVQLHANSSFSVSGDKKGLTTTLTRALLDKLLRGKQDWVQVAAVLGAGLSSKHLQTNFNDTTAQGLANKYGWDGSLVSTLPGSILSNTFNDYLAIFDANVSGNKSNYFVKDKANYTTSVGLDGTVTAKLTLTYRHTGTSDIWPGGKYKNYLTVYTPAGSVLQKAELDGHLTSVESTSLSGLSGFSLFFDVPVGGERSVSLTYQLPGKISSATPTNYQLQLHKQPGSNDTAFSFAISTSPNFQIPSSRSQSFPFSNDKLINLIVAP